MPTGSIQSTNQRIAFDLLRRETIDAHLKEDGLTVGLLCATASESLDSLLNRQELAVSLKDVTWVPILQLYWMLDFHTAQVTVETTHKVPCIDARDESLKLLLEAYWYLISEPLSGWDEAHRRLSSLDLTIFANYEAKDLPKEYEELFTHIIELAWFRLAGSETWTAFLREWKEAAPSWIAMLTEELEKRLYWQTRLINPSRWFPLVSESERSQLSTFSPFADVWLLNLHGRNQQVVERVKNLSILPVSAYERRILLDFWHVNRFFFPSVSKRVSENTETASKSSEPIENSSPVSEEKETPLPNPEKASEETQMTWLARRRQVSATLPILQFHDRRELEIERELSILYRQRDKSNASNRFEAMRLAMLHELAAMRIWDYGMWRDAVKAQSVVWLDASIWMQNQPGRAAQGLILGSRSLSLRVNKNDLLTDSAIEHLEFAPSSVLAEVSEQLLAGYPIAKFSASELIDEIADFFPPAIWPALAEWTVIASRELDDHRSSGQKTGFAVFWSKLLPDLNVDSPIWETLKTEALNIAAIPYCWNGKYAVFLYQWMKHAPRVLCEEVGQKIVSIAVSEDQLIFSLYRAELLVDVEQGRTELGRTLTSLLPNPAPRHEERLLLSEHLGSASYQHEAETARIFFASKLQERISKIAPSEGEGAQNLPLQRLGLSRIKSWLSSDQPLLESLLTAVERRNINRKFIPEMLNAIQFMIAFGPPEFSVLARPRISSWISATPSGSLPSSDHNSPFSGYHITEAGLNQAHEQLAWIVYQFVKIEGAGAKDLVDLFLDHALRNQWRDPVGILCRSLIVLATKLDPATAALEVNSVRQLIDILRAQYAHDKAVGDEIAEVLSFLVGLFGPSRQQLVDWDTPQSRTVLEELVRVLEVTLEPLGEMATPRIRANLARTLADLSRLRDLPSNLSQLLTKLSLDNRAQVRRAAR